MSLPDRNAWQQLKLVMFCFILNNLYTSSTGTASAPFSSVPFLHPNWTCQTSRVLARPETLTLAPRPGRCHALTNTDQQDET